MSISRFVASASAAVALCFSGSVATAGPYSDVYVFGDSLSDIGRDAALTGGYPGPAFGYATGRFSNGPVALETTTLDLTGSPLTLAHDYAYGGARTGVSPFPNTMPGASNPNPPLSDNNSDLLTGTGLLNQTAMFTAGLSGNRADPNALYVVWAGANDFSQPQVLQNAGGTQWSRIIGNIETAITNLAADGAQHFFVPNVPNLGLTPEALAAGPLAAAGASLLTGQFDLILAQSLAGFDAAQASLDVKTFDVYGYMTSFIAQVQSNGSYRGISDVTSMCQTTPGCDPAHAFFWDDEHPTGSGSSDSGRCIRRRPGPGARDLCDARARPGRRGLGGSTSSPRTFVSPTYQETFLDPTVSIALTVNGKAVEARIDPRTLLVQFLRDQLELTGTHVGCDTAQCGACTVHLDGRAIKSCSVLALQVQGSEVTTIEGLAPAGTLHPMQEAFRECHGLQCGFCTPGMVMSGVDLLENNPDASEADIREALDGNICRCTGYQNIVKSIQFCQSASRQGTAPATAAASAAR